MSSVLLDSDVIVEVMRRRDWGLVARWESLIQGSDPIACTPITIAELWRGARPREHAVLESLFNSMDCIALDFAIGRRAGDYPGQFAKSHAVQLGDALVAATASVHGLRLWTRNRKHYPMKDVDFY